MVSAAWRLAWVSRILSLHRRNSRIPIRILSHSRNQGPLCNPIDLVHCSLIHPLCSYQCVHNLLLFFICSMSQSHRHMDNSHPLFFDRFLCSTKLSGLPTFRFRWNNSRWRSTLSHLSWSNHWTTYISYHNTQYTTLRLWQVHIIGHSVWLHRAIDYYVLGSMGGWSWFSAIQSGLQI